MHNTRNIVPLKKENATTSAREASQAERSKKLFAAGDVLQHEGQSYLVVARTTHKNTRGATAATGLLLRYAPASGDTFIKYRQPPPSDRLPEATAGAVSICAMGGQEMSVTPSERSAAERVERVTPKQMGKCINGQKKADKKKKEEKQWIPVSLDAEWQEIDGKRKVLTQQWGFFGQNDGEVYIWVVTFKSRPHMNTIVGWLFEVMEQAGVAISRDVALELRTFYGIVDLSTMLNKKGLLKSTDTVRGTLVSIEKGMKIEAWNKTRKYKRRITATVRDLMLLAPNGSSLASIGESIGVPKVELPEGYDKGEMARLLREEPEAFLVYSAQDALITLLWPKHAYGDGPLDVSLGSKAAREMRDIIKSNRGWVGDKASECNQAFDYHWRGYTKQESGSWTDAKGRLHKRYITVSRPEATIAHRLASEAFYGGRNECFIFGIDPKEWTDYDLSGAYASAMAMLPDIDWDKQPDVLTGEVEPIESPTLYIFGRVRFSFPVNTKYPCLPVRDPDGAGLVFPLEGETYASAPELWLAQKMGAKLEWVGPGLRLHQRPEKSLLECMKVWIADREAKKREYGKKSVQEIMAKERNNSGYGKLAQGLAGSRGWSTRHEKMQDIPPSAVTSPIHAAMITGLIRACVSAAMVDLERQGAVVGSVTTDGFLVSGNADIDACHGFGLLDMMREARRQTANSDEIWEIKHRARGCAFMRTRGQIGIKDEEAKEAPPIARAGYKAPPDKKHDPDYLLGLFIERNGYLEFDDKALPSARDYSLRDADGIAKRVKRRVSWEFDHKRRWINPRTTTTNVKGLVVHHIICDTEPWRTFEDFKSARMALAGRPSLESVKSLRDFEHTQAVISIDAEARKKHRIAGINKGGVWRAWAISTLRGIRAGELSAKWIASATPKEILAKVGQAFGVVLTTNDWKNAGRQERQNAILAGAEAYLEALGLREEHVTQDTPPPAPQTQQTELAVARL